VRLGPDTFEVRADIDLGGEGVIVRRFNGEPFDLVTRETAQAPFRLFAQPALLGELSDGRYRIQSRWFTGSFQSTPLTATVKNGVQDISGGVVMDGFLGIPQATAPEHGTTGLPEDRVLRWEADGSEADFHMVQVLGGDGNPAWRHFVAGDVSRAPVPDLSSIPEVNDIASGSVFWVVYAIRIPGFDFDRFNYTHINQRLWSAWAADQFTAGARRRRRKRPMRERGCSSVRTQHAVHLCPQRGIFGAPAERLHGRGQGVRRRHRLRHVPSRQDELPGQRCGPLQRRGLGIRGRRGVPGRRGVRLPRQPMQKPL
jgi:hypothetical protein